MSRPSRTAWLLGGSLFSVATIGFGTLNLVDLLAHERSHVHLEFTEPVHGRSTSTATAAPSASRAPTTPRSPSTPTSARACAAAHHSEQVEGDRLVVRATCPRFLSTWCGVDYTIRVPRDVAVVAHVVGLRHRRHRTSTATSSVALLRRRRDRRPTVRSATVDASSERRRHVQLTLRRRHRRRSTRHLERRRRHRRGARHARCLPGRRRRRATAAPTSASAPTRPAPA